MGEFLEIANFELLDTNFHTNGNDFEFMSRFTDGMCPKENPSNEGHAQMSSKDEQDLDFINLLFGPMFPEEQETSLEETNECQDDIAKSAFIKKSSKPNQTPTFISISESEKSEFLTNMRNKNTVRKTESSLKQFQRWLSEPPRNETRNITHIMPVELDNYIGSFLLSVRKADGTDYEPDTLTSYHRGLDRAFVGHKWIVFMAAFTVAFLNYGIIVTMGALYVGMLDTYNAGRAKTALVQSLGITFSLGFGIISGYLVDRFGVRIVTSFAALMTALGFTLSFFSTTIYELYGYISVIAGMGFATMYVSAVVCVGQVFSGRQKSIALSLQSGGTALSGFLWPNVLHASFDMYSLRGTFLLLGGMLLNNMAFAIIFGNCDNDKRNVETKTVKEHGKAYIVTDCATEVTEIDNEIDPGLDVYKSNDSQEVVNENAEQNSDVKSKVGKQNNKDQVVDVLETNEKTDVHYQVTGRIDKEDISKNDKNKNEVDNTEEDAKDSLKSPNECDRGNIDEESQKIEQETTKITETELKGRKQEISSWKILLSIFVVAGTLNISSLFGFLTVYQDMNIFNGLTTEQSDLTFMSYALLNVLSRFLPIIPAKVDCISLFTVPVVTSLSGAIGQIIFLATPSLTGAIVAMAFAGVADGGWSASMQAIVFELLPEEKQAVGFGLVLTAFGIASGATGPIFGSLRDDTSSYQTVLIITTSLFLISALLESVCLLLSKRFKK